MLGWVAVFYLPEILATGGVAVVVLLAIGGGLYSIGGVVYAIKKPNRRRGGSASTRSSMH